VSGLHSDDNRVLPRRHAYPDANSHSNGNSNRNRHGYGYSDCNHHSNCHCYAAVYPDTKAHSSAKTAAYPSATSGLKPVDYQLYERPDEN
jgi:hypothetical protein